MKRNLYILFLLFIAAAVHAQIINIETRRFLKDTNGFVGTISGNFNVNQNTQQVLTVGLNQHLQYKHNKHRFLSISDLAFIKAGKTDFVNAGYQHFRYNYRFNYLITLEAFVQGQYNKVLQLDRRYLAGTGPRIKILKKEMIRIYLGCLYMYEYQSQANESIRQYNNRISSYLTLSLSFKKTEFTSTTFYQPHLGETNNYRIANDSSFELGINNHLNFKIGFNLLYDTHQPPGVPELTYILKNGLTYKF